MGLSYFFIPVLYLSRRNDQKTVFMKKGLTTSLLAALLGGIQMYWFFPGGLSCFDATSGIWDAIELLMTIQFLATLIIGLVFKERIRFYVFLAFLSSFWLCINKHEFTYRHACWSTYLEHEIWLYTLSRSILPMAVCLGVFILGYFLLPNHR